MNTTIRPTRLRTLLTGSARAAVAPTRSAAAVLLAALLAAPAPLVGQHGPEKGGAGEAGASAASPALFQAAGPCMACHNGLSAPTGEDISLGTDWRGSMMANAARDPYWQAAVRRETMDHPAAAAAIQDECSKCHMPMMRFQAHASGGLGEVFVHAPALRAATPEAVLAADGVSCTVCHQIREEGLGQEETFTGGFRIDTRTPVGERVLHGPFAVAPGPARAMQSSALFAPTRGGHIQDAALCASCHTLYTHARNDRGEVVGELPEQVPYLEWLHSAYREDRSCQSCHMPVVAGETPVTSVLPTPRPEVSRHVFRGGNFLMPRMLNAFRGELAVGALPVELDAVSARTVENLEARTARVELSAPVVEEGRLRFTVTVANLAGHKLPTAYPSRRAWLHVTVSDAAGRSLFESGALQPDGSIAGNDNDRDPGRYEPHHAQVRDPEQVQVYEAIMVDAGGRVTTGLLQGMRYAKDNRLLPRGFDKAACDPDVAVHGAAAGDPDFGGGGDAVEFSVALDEGARPATVRAELWYQPIGFRWARNLADYDAMETNRFVGYYGAMASVSGHPVAGATRAVPYAGAVPAVPSREATRGNGDCADSSGDRRQGTAHTEVRP